MAINRYDLPDDHPARWAGDNCDSLVLVGGNELIDYDKHRRRRGDA
ncbi:MAG: hypothetical protein QOC62_3785 [Mycobacterium sp.]|nr:hypothetical protein [Mycobacterium sp.]